MAKIPVIEHVQVNFRMPADLKARIEAAAASNARSTTAEIVATLEEKYPAPPQAQLDLEVLTMAQWLDFVEAAQTESEFQERLQTINRRLAASPATRRLMVKVHEGDDKQRHVLVMRAGFPHPDASPREVMAKPDILLGKDR